MGTSRQHGDALVVAMGTTNSQGRVRVEERVTRWSDLAAMRVVADLIFDPVQETPLALESDSDTVVLQLPPSGEVLVRGAGNDAVMAVDDEDTLMYQRVADRSGNLRFGPIGLGLDLGTGDRPAAASAVVPRTCRGR